jgi:hypothetical protein
VGILLAGDFGPVEERVKRQREGGSAQRPVFIDTAQLSDNNVVV